MAFKKASIALLASVHLAMSSEPGYFLATEKEASELISAGLIEQNRAIAEGDKFATRLTPAGIEHMSKANVTNEPKNDSGAGLPGPENTGNEDSGNTGGSTAGFAIDDGISLPQARGGKGGSVYPFDALAVNQSFFVPETADMPNPAKTLASTVSSATARYAVPVEGETVDVKVKVYQTNAAGEKVKGADGKFIVTGDKMETRPKMRETRKFTVRSVDETAAGRGKGARVWRTA